MSEKAVRRIAGRAAAEALPGRAVTATGVTAAVRGQRAEVSLDLALPYPASVADSVGLVQEHVAARTRQLSGLDVPRRRPAWHARAAVPPRCAGSGARRPGTRPRA
ncbi:Asp23/Gls24 family envelope stress response protein, partial [Streptomyces sp. NPDC053705]